MLNWFFRLTTDTGPIDRYDDLIGFQQSRLIIYSAVVIGTAVVILAYRSTYSTQENEDNRPLRKGYQDQNWKHT